MRFSTLHMLVRLEADNDTFTRRATLPESRGAAPVDPCAGAYLPAAYS
jgi:hypothetical protein